MELFKKMLVATIVGAIAMTVSDVSAMKRLRAGQAVVGLAYDAAQRTFLVLDDNTKVLVRRSADGSCWFTGGNRKLPKHYSDFLNNNTGAIACTNNGAIVQFIEVSNNPDVDLDGSELEFDAIELMVTESALSTKVFTEPTIEELSSDESDDALMIEGKKPVVNNNNNFFANNNNNNNGNLNDKWMNKNLDAGNPGAKVNMPKALPAPEKKKVLPIFKTKNNASVKPVVEAPKVPAVRESLTTLRTIPLNKEQRKQREQEEDARREAYYQAEREQAEYEQYVQNLTYAATGVAVVGGITCGVIANPSLANQVASGAVYGALAGTVAYFGAPVVAERTGMPSDCCMQ